jgi:hypothetical protein
MHNVLSCSVWALLFVAAGCSGAAKPVPQPPENLVEPAVQELRAARFAEALLRADAVLADYPASSRAAAVRAVAHYQTAMHTILIEGGAVVDSAGHDGRFDHGRMRSALNALDQALGAVEADLAIAAADPQFFLELCLACWERDWNHSGEIDDRDRLLFQIEVDAGGRPIPEGDPRRRPTFRFDRGDVHWAQAMVAFQRAALSLVLAYRWTELDRILSIMHSSELPVITIRLASRERMAAARAALLRGLEYAEKSRLAYLAEVDDDREWVPNPRQTSHPLPLPVDQALYDTWGGVLRDLRGLVTGSAALSVAELADLGDHKWDNPPGGYILLGAMLSEPGDIVFDLPALSRSEAIAAAGVEAMLRLLLGDYYVPRAEPTPLIRRLARMKREVERSEESLERKLRYLFWLN